MRNIIILLTALVFLSCQSETDKNLVKKPDWGSRKSEIVNFDDYVQGKTYLPVYSHIYHIHEHKSFDLTITISIRNVSLTDSVYILKADYYRTPLGVIKIDIPFCNIIICFFIHLPHKDWN